MKRISQGSVATHLRCGGIFSDSVIAKLIFSWFWQWKNLENPQLFRKELSTSFRPIPALTAYAKRQFFVPRWTRYPCGAQRKTHVSFILHCLLCFYCVFILLFSFCGYYWINICCCCCCHGTAFLLVFVCRLQWIIICQKVTSTWKNQSNRIFNANK